MNKLFINVFFAAIAASAQPGLAPPRLGFIAGADHTLRPVLGLSGNLLLGSPAAADVSSAAWSGSFGLIKTSSSLMAFDASHMLASVDAVPGPALFAFQSTGSPAFALLPVSRQLYAWTGAAFQAVSFRADLLGGEPLAIAEPRLGRLSLIVQRDDGLWRLDLSVRGDLEAQTALPGVPAPVLLQDDGTLLYTDKTALVIRDRTGSERKIETGISIGDLRSMGRDWVQLLEAHTGRQYAVRTTLGLERVSQLPEAR